MTEFDIGTIVMIALAVLVVGVTLTGLKIIRPTHRAAIETLGKYTGFRKSGLTFVIPIFQKLYSVNITEKLVEVEKQEVITKDNLNCNVDAQVYYKVSEDEDSLKKALYAVNNYESQIVQLARTTLRNVIGTKEFTTVNSDRKVLNSEIFESIQNETLKWGISILKVELKEVVPPPDVQETMNQIIKASNAKSSAIDFATAKETEADGEKRASIKRSEGIKQSRILEAEGQATAITKVAEATAKQIELVNTAANTYFKENAVKLKQLEVTQASLQNNSKIIITEDGLSPTIVVNESDTKIIPTREPRK